MYHFLLVWWRNNLMYSIFSFLSKWITFEIILFSGFKCELVISVWDNVNMSQLHYPSLLGTEMCRLSPRSEVCSFIGYWLPGQETQVEKWLASALPVVTRMKFGYKYWTIVGVGVVVQTDSQCSVARNPICVAASRNYLWILNMVRTSFRSVISYR